MRERSFLCVRITCMRFLLFARYVPNAAKRSMTSMHILTTDRRPTWHVGKFRMAISLQRVSRFTSCVVLG